jgi:excisionase family DNA binding protein
MLLTIKAVATRLQIKPSTLYAWAAQGRIPCLKIHGLVRFNSEEIDRWVESFRAQTPPPTLKSHSNGPRTALDELIARAKEHAYNPAPRGNQTQSSPIGKEKTDGAI